jgi:hypothetical protein
MHEALPAEFAVKLFGYEIISPKWPPNLCGNARACNPDDIIFLFLDCKSGNSHSRYANTTPAKHVNADRDAATTTNRVEYWRYHTNVYKLFFG